MINNNKNYINRYKYINITKKKFIKNEKKNRYINIQITIYKITIKTNLYGILIN